MSKPRNSAGNSGHHPAAKNGDRLYTLEVVLTEVPAKLRRKKRADLGIALIDMSARAG